MALTKGHLSRLRRALRPHLARGWERAVFATPEQDGRRDERVSLGPGTEGPPGDAAIAALLADAEAAAQAGYVKQTIVVDPRRRVQVDARHGHAQVRTLDDAAAAKVMGGKERAFRPDESGALLRAIGIMNADGTISARHARKYKQISHLAELCRPTWERLTQARPGAPLRILDLACGNAYLSFVLAESLRLAGLDLRLHGVDVRADVVERSRQRAAELGHQGISFAVSTIAAAAADAPAALGGDADLIVALHACDTATDEALELAIAAGTPAVLAVPCCQHELAAQLADRGRAAPSPLPAIAAHGLLRGAYADLLTDALRVDLLDACGYAVDVVEFVGSEHTAKNLLIRAHRRHPAAPVDPSRWRLGPLVARCAELGVDPQLLRRLRARQAAVAAGGAT